ncbi:MAG: EAL domain-containing protein [Pseudanabaena sp. CRU_2_10]|nr:EAL domain-containing protein [Pseudanabaena sp. CRU_2_10]
MISSYQFDRQLDLQQKTILIVDDIPTNLLLLSKALTEGGYDVRCAKNGYMALVGAQSEPPDLILLDVIMPDIDGFDVCMKLKENPLTCEIPVIFLSALDEVIDKVRAFEVGGVDYITKPFQSEEVLARVKNHIALQAAKAEIRQLNEALEQRVRLRTTELEAANQELQREITERQIAEELLVYNALHDPLTGLPNRVLFVDRAEMLLKKAKRNPNYTFALLFLDFDRFKLINDSLGHLVGDQLLIAISQLLQDSVRMSDTIARLGGDEFTILLDDIHDISEPSKVAERIQEALKAPLLVEGFTVFTSVSIGIAISSVEYVSSSELLRDADIAMYRAKEKGACHEIFNPGMHAEMRHRLQIENDLRRAIEQKEFLVYYQPIISLQTGELVGFEALIRWQHPERGLVPPIQFIPVAEDTGLIVAIGEWVMQEACRQLHTWQKQYPSSKSLKIAVNLASKEIGSPDLLGKIDRILAATGLDASSLRIEITESMLMEYGEATNNLLLEIQARKIRLSIDDFGQGYSSLSYLHRLPVDTLKIDRAFVSQMHLKGENFEIVRTIATLAHTLGMDIVAEGVETLEQFATLRDLGCEFAQGYLFAPPLNAQAASDTIANHRSWLSLVERTTQSK